MASGKEICAIHRKGQLWLVYGFAILRSIQQVVSNWRAYARRNGIAKADMELMSPAFKV